MSNQDIVPRCLIYNQDIVPRSTNGWRRGITASTGRTSPSSSGTSFTSSGNETKDQVEREL